MEYNFFSKFQHFDECCKQTDSQKKMYAQINHYVDLCNNWQVEDDFNVVKAKKLLAKFECARQTIFPRGSMYSNYLDDMEEFINECIK